MRAESWYLFASGIPNCLARLQTLLRDITRHEVRAHLPKCLRSKSGVENVDMRNDSGSRKWLRQLCLLSDLSTPLSEISAVANKSLSTPGMHGRRNSL